MRIIGLAGWSGAGKTTLLTRVIPRLVERGLKVSTLKHAHHAFDIDKPGKDSFRHREAGATEVLVASENRYAVMHELRGAPEPSIAELLGRLSPVDLVIIEGWKAAPYAKVEVYRQEVGKPPIYPDDHYILGIASDVPLPHASLPVIALADADAVMALMLEKSELLSVVMKRLTSPSPVMAST